MNAIKIKNLIFRLSFTCAAILLFVLTAIVVPKARQNQNTVPEETTDAENTKTEIPSTQTPETVPETQPPEIETQPSETQADPETQPPETQPPQPPVTEPPQTEYFPPNNYEPYVYPDEYKMISDLGTLQPNILLGETQDKGEDYLNRIMFLGDSRTYGMKYYEVLPNGWNTKNIWTPTSGTLTLSQVNTSFIVYPETGTEMTVKDAVRLRKPEILMVSLGVNGISFMSQVQFEYAFSVLISNVRAESPNTIIVIQSMWPVCGFYRNWNSINNHNITEGNAWLYKIACDNGVYFLDSSQVLADANGYLATEYQNGDGLHPNAAGYSRILEYIRTHAVIQ